MAGVYTKWALDISGAQFGLGLGNWALMVRIAIGPWVSKLIGPKPNFFDLFFWLTKLPLAFDFSSC